MVTLILYDFLLIWTKNLGQTAQNIGGAESAPPRTIHRPKSPDFLGLTVKKVLYMEKEDSNEIDKINVCLLT